MPPSLPIEALAIGGDRPNALDPAGDHRADPTYRRALTDRHRGPYSSRHLRSCRVAWRGANLPPVAPPSPSSSSNALPAAALELGALRRMPEADLLATAERWASTTPASCARAT
jgi:hypothetical protein